TGIAAILVDISDVTARKMLARDNRSRDKATYNDFLLADFLSELNDLDGSGWEPAELDDLLKSTGALAADTTAFLTTFTEPDVSEAAQALTPAGAAPAANPFSHAPQQPGGMPPQDGTGQAAQPGVEGHGDGTEQPTPADGSTDNHEQPAVPGQPNPIHTGPTPYQGPGAPATAGMTGPQLPSASITNVGWAVTLEQRDTIRNAIKQSKELNNVDDAAAAITAICQHYLDTHTTTTADTTADA